MGTSRGQWGWQAVHSRQAVSSARTVIISTARLSASRIGRPAPEKVWTNSSRLRTRMTAAVRSVSVVSQRARAWWGAVPSGRAAMKALS